MVNIDPNQEYEMEELVDYISLRDDFKCQLCSNEGQQRHHVVPKSMHGPDCANNLILLCMQCHGEVEIAPHLIEEDLKKIIAKNERKLRESLV